MTDTRQTLGFEAQAAISTIARVAQELAQYNAAIQSAASATANYNQFGGRFERVVSAQATAVRQFGQQTTQATNSLKGFDQLRDIEQNLRNTFRGVASDVEEAGRRGQAAAQGILLSWQSVVRLFTIQALHQVVSLLTHAFRESITEAREFEIGLAEIQTIGQGLNKDFESLATSVQAVSEEFGQSSEIIAEGLYQTLSNQVVDASDSFEFLRTASQFATAAVTDTGSAVNLLSSVVNAYGATAGQTDDIAGKLFKTIEVGRFRASELANTFGRVAVLSSQLGVSLDETLTSLATLTVQGLRYNEAFTLITNTQLKLIRPSEALKQTYQDLGVASAEAGIQAFGFQGFLEQLTQTTGGTASEIGELFNRVRAIRGVLGLTSDATERFNENLKLISEADVGTLDEAAAKVFETEAKQFEIELTRVQNLFLNLGRDAVKAINDITGVFGGLKEAGVAVFTAITAGAGTYTAFVFGPFLAAQAASAASFVTLQVSTFGWVSSLAAARTAALAALTTPLGAAVAAGSAVLLLAAAWDDVAEAATSAAESEVDSIEAASEAAKLAEEVRRRATERAEGVILSQTQRVLQQRQRLFQQDAENARVLQEAVFDGLADQIGDRLGVFESFVSKLRDTAIDTEDKIRSLKDSLADARAEVENFTFERSLRGLDPVQAAFVQIERSQDQLRQSQEALAAGDAERAKELQRQAVETAKAALSAADRSDNAATIFRAERQVTDALNERVQIDQQLLDQQKQFQQQATQLAGIEQARNTRLQIAVDRFKEFELISEGLVVDPDVDVEEAREELSKLSAFIQTELEAGASSAQLLEKFDPELSEIRKRLQETFTDPVSGAQVSDLSSLVDLSFGRIVGILSQQAASLSADQKIALSDLIDIDFNDILQQIQGFGPAQNRLAQLPNAQNNAERATEDQINKQAELETAIAKTDETTRVLFTRLINAARNGTEEVGFLADVFNQLFTVEADATDLGVASEIGVLIRDIRSISQQDIISTESADEALEKLTRLNEIGRQFEIAGFEEISEDISDIGEQLRSAFSASNELQAINEAAEPLRIIEERVGNLGEAFQNNNVEVGQNFISASQAGANGFQSASTSIQSNLQQEIDLLRQRNQLQSQAGGSSSATRQFGGPMFRSLGGILHRAAGGFARGTDNVLASLTAGESVNTVASTRQFFPQIQAMNAGVIPQFRQDGGTVTNVGDITTIINEASTPRETSREVMANINRQIRRGTFNLRSR